MVSTAVEPVVGAGPLSLGLFTLVVDVAALRVAVEEVEFTFAGVAVAALFRLVEELGGVTLLVCLAAVEVGLVVGALVRLLTVEVGLLLVDAGRVVVVGLVVAEGADTLEELAGLALVDGRAVLVGRVAVED